MPHSELDSAPLFSADCYMVIRVARLRNEEGTTMVSCKPSGVLLKTRQPGGICFQTTRKSLLQQPRAATYYANPS